VVGWTVGGGGCLGGGGGGGGGGGEGRGGGDCVRGLLGGWWKVVGGVWTTPGINSPPGPAIERLCAETNYLPSDALNLPQTVGAETVLPGKDAETQEKEV